MGCTGSEDDSLETGFGLATSRSEFFVEDLESGPADSGGVGKERDWCGGMLLLETLEGVVDLLRQRCISCAEGEDLGGSELPGVAAGVGCIDPVMWGDSLVDVENEGHRAGVFGLAEVETIARTTES